MKPQGEHKVKHAITTRLKLCEVLHNSLLGALTVKNCYHTRDTYSALCCTRSYLNDPLTLISHAARWMTEVKIMQILTSLSCPMWNPKFVSY